MNTNQAIYVFGCGAIGFPLAAHLVRAGRNVTAVRTGTGRAGEIVELSVRQGDEEFSASIRTVPLDAVREPEGILVIATKSYTNQVIADRLRHLKAAGPVVILQNGINVEAPFLEAGFGEVHRGVLYVTSQPEGGNAFSFRSVRSSPIGIVMGTEPGLGQCVDHLATSGFPFHREESIQAAVWRKTIINAVFNSICPLLDVDNGIFSREESVFELARDVVRECLGVTGKLGIALSEEDILGGVRLISGSSGGTLISTLQDLRNGRPTEIASLNLEIARIAATFDPPLRLPKTELLGKLIAARQSGAPPARETKWVQS